MKFLFKISIVFTFVLFFTGCTEKLIVKSLQPSTINAKIKNIIIEEFSKDNIHQADNIEDVLSNHIINKKRIFNIKTTYDNIDAIITGKILDSSLDYDFYYDDETYSRCNKDGKCREYVRHIPCERKDFNLKTKIQVLNKNEQVLFSKIYTKTDFSDECHKHGRFFGPLFYNFHKKEKEKIKVNSQLSYEIAKDFLNDIAVHYDYEKVPLISDLSASYTDKQKEKFKLIMKFIKDKNINTAYEKFQNLNKELNNKSYEVLYNIALIDEVKNSFINARLNYKKAKSLCEDSKDLKLIQKALNRVNKNINNKKKAILQLY